jgi:plasmid stabilization system protein ParE
MDAKLVIAPEAERDLDEGYAWYEERRAGLGEEFLSCIDARIQTIIRSPESCATVHESYRRALVRRFPYSIFYEYEENVVTVYCVFHNSRDPDKWRSRLK